MSSTYEFDTDRLAGSGIFIKGIAGEAVGNRKLVYMGPLGTWLLADADLAATLPGLGLTLNGANLGGRIRLLLKGYVGFATWTWTVGGEIYASSTAGELTQVAAGFVQIVGMAGPSTDFIYFNGDFNTGAGGVVCALLEGATAYVGSDICKGTNYTNYFTVDGVADEVQINQAIIYAIGLGGGTVYLEEGTYNCVDTIASQEEIILQGEGAQTTILAFTTAGAVNCIEVNVGGAQASFGAIRDLGVVAVGGASLIGVLVNQINRFEIVNCDIRDHGSHGVFFQTCFVGLISGGIVVDNAGRGIYLDSCTGIQIKTVEVRDNTTWNITLDDSNGCTIGPNVWMENGTETTGHIELLDAQQNQVISNKIFSTNGNARGIFIHRSGDEATKNIISNNEINLGASSNLAIDADESEQIITDNYFQTCGGGLDLEENGHIVSDNKFNTIGAVVAGCIAAPNQTTISGNRILSVTGTGIFFGSDCTISDNYVDTCTINGINAAGDDSTITGNTAINNTSYGIRVNAGANRVVVRDNILSGNVAGQILDNGTDTKLPWIFVEVSDPNAVLGRHPVVDMPNNTDTDIYAQFMAPLEFQELVAAQVILVAGASGNLVWLVNTDFGKLCASEDYDTHSDAGGDTTALTIDDLECIDISASLTVLAAGDLVGVNFFRDGDAGGDTIEDSVYYMGLRVRYV